MSNILIIGGAGSTIGNAVTKKLLEDPTHTVVTTSHEKQPQGAMRSDRLSIRQLDIRNETALQECINAFCQTHGCIDILINNAGILKDTFASVMKSSEWQDVIDVNLTGIFYSCKHVSRKMIARKRGKIINVASYKGMVGCRGQVNYSASKAGVIALTKSLARELGKFNISVNAVCPGFISSKLNGFSGAKVQRAREESLLDIKYNLSDIANFIAFLCSDQLQSVSGQVFCIDSRIH
jgi:3-oxoacyl-[acyl-carrier protein] reductase